MVDVALKDGYSEAEVKKALVLSRSEIPAAGQWRDNLRQVTCSLVDGCGHVGWAHMVTERYG